MLMPLMSVVMPIKSTLIFCSPACALAKCSMAASVHVPITGISTVSPPLSWIEFTRTALPSKKLCSVQTTSADNARNVKSKPNGFVKLKENFTVLEMGSYSVSTIWGSVIGAPRMPPVPFDPPIRSVTSGGMISPVGLSL